MVIKQLLILLKIFKFYYLIKIIWGIGDWGLGIGDWGLGIGPNPQSPIPNPQLKELNFLIFNLRN